MSNRHRRLFTEDELMKLHEGAIEILTNMGIRVEYDIVLDLLKARGAKINWSDKIAVLPEELIKNVIEIQRGENESVVRNPDDGYLPEIEIGGGGSCVFYYDWATGKRRLADGGDLIRMLKLADVLQEVKAVAPPVIDSTVSPKIEAIKACQQMIENVFSTKILQPELLFAGQVKYLAEIGQIYNGDPKQFLSIGNCPTSPLTFSERLLMCAMEKSRYKVHFAVPTMPISGVNAPVTRAGTIVVGLAEILGGWVIAKVIDEETPVSAATISGVMDMSNGEVLFSCPEAILQDVGIYEVCRYIYDAPCAIFASYIDGHVPGMRVMYEKIFKQMALGHFCYYAVHDGTLAAAKVFSPTQLMIDIEIHQSLREYHKHPEVNADTLALDVIKEVGWKSDEYLISKHTLANFKNQFWFSKLLERTSWKNDEEEKGKEMQLLERAEAQWQEAISKYKPLAIDDKVKKEIDKVVKKSEQELL